MIIKQYAQAQRMLWTYGVSKFRCILAFIGNLTGVQRYRRLDGSLHNQTSKVYNQALTLSGDVPDQSQRLLVP